MPEAVAPDAVIALADAVDAQRYGGKASGLAAAIRAGLSVPAGAVISVELAARIAAADGDAIAALHAAAAPLAGFARGLAVRSSAAAEDSATASFAGQHATVLNVCDPRGLVDAVREVVNSATSPAALGYRARLGIAAPPRMAVIVQCLIDSTVAGVLFTRNPLNGVDERIIEASWGLGEAVVAGMVVPDRYRIARDGEIRERAAGSKDQQVARRPAGGTELEHITGPRRRALCLADDQLRALAALATGCEACLPASAPAGLDLEFAFDGGAALHLIQVRPITSAHR